MGEYQNPVPLANDVHEALDEAGVKCPDMGQGSLCLNVAEFLVERGWVQELSCPETLDRAADLLMRRSANMLIAPLPNARWDLLSEPARDEWRRRVIELIAVANGAES